MRPPVNLPVTYTNAWARKGSLRADRGRHLGSDRPTVGVMGEDGSPPEAMATSEVGEGTLD